MDDSVKELLDEDEESRIYGNSDDLLDNCYAEARKTMPVAKHPKPTVVQTTQKAQTGQEYERDYERRFGGKSSLVQEPTPHHQPLHNNTK